MELAVHTILIVVQLIALHLLSRHLNRTLFSRFGTVVYLLVSLPGTIIHELSHYVGCLLTWTRVREVRLFSPQREGEQIVLGYVRHDKPKNPLSSFVIGTAPFFGGATALWFAAVFLVPGAIDAMRVSLAHGGVLSVAGSYFTFVVEMLKSIAVWDWRAFVMLYLLISVPTHLAPSTTDLKNAAWGTVLVAVIIGLAAAGSAIFGWDASGLIFDSLESGLALLVGLLTFALLCCIVVTSAVTVISRLIHLR
ncbi:MAG: hypothetical protein U9Q03_00150 [Patescibacteria group bacterium]|nr:hypothetical protein [Patescibacteria group bacterium]